METEKLYDEEYFRQRAGLEDKHFHEALIWWHAFRPKKVIELGCGLGHRVYALNFIGIDTEGCDLEYPITHTPYTEYKDKFKVGTASDPPYVDEAADLVIAYDLLEHLLDTNAVAHALKEMHRVTAKYIIISVPVIGDPNLEKDPTHMIKKTMEWWEYQVTSAGFRLLPKPNNVPFRSQMIWAEKL